MLYQMLTGQRAFKGEDVSETLAAVLRHDLDWTALPASMPAPIRQLLARCLERDVKRRLRDIGEARIVLADPAASETTSDPMSRGTWRWAPWVTAAVLALIGGVGWWGWLHVSPTPPRTVTRSATNLASFAVSPVLSGDGTRLVYTNLSGSQPGIWMRLMDQLEGKPVPGPAPEVPRSSRRTQNGSPTSLRVRRPRSGKFATLAVRRSRCATRRRRGK